MTFVKPNITYTEIAIWIDNNAYLTDCNDAVLYRYIYYLVNMCAHECSLFKKLEDYDQYALYCASRLLLRIRNPAKQTPETKIKSILNYIKTIIKDWRADYELEFHIESEDFDTISVGSFDLGDHLLEELSYHDIPAYAKFTCNDIVHVVSKHLSQIPRRKNSPEWTNIYISCMLTLNDRIQYTLSAVKTRPHADIYTAIERAFKEARYREPILFHLDKTKSNYIDVLVVEIQHAISAELSYEAGMKISSVNSIKSLIRTALTEDEED